MSGAWREGPARPRLPEASADLWLVDLDAPAEPPAGLLAAAEVQRRERIREPTAGRRWALSRWALREVLGRYLRRDPARLEIREGAHGKPRLGGAGALEFNLSHSEGRALVAVAGRPVGVDVELAKPRRNLLALAERGLDPDAAARVREAAPERREAAFYAAWTAHEARLKCGGGGLGNPAPEHPIAVLPVGLDDGYAAAVALASSAPFELRRYRLDLV